MPASLWHHVCDMVCLTIIVEFYVLRDCPQRRLHGCWPQNLLCICHSWLLWTSLFTAGLVCFLQCPPQRRLHGYWPHHRLFISRNWLPFTLLLLPTPSSIITQYVHIWRYITFCVLPVAQHGLHVYFIYENLIYYGYLSTTLHNRRRTLRRYILSALYQAGRMRRIWFIESLQ